MSDVYHEYGEFYKDSSIFFVQKEVTMNIIFLVLGFAAGFIFVAVCVSVYISKRPDGVLLIDQSREVKDIYRFVLLTTDLDKRTFALFRIDTKAQLKEIATKTSTFMDT